MTRTNNNMTPADVVLDKESLALALSRAVRRGDLEWMQEWLVASLWDGRSWILYTDQATAEPPAPSTRAGVVDDETAADPPELSFYRTSLLHKVLQETPTEGLPSLLRILLRHGADPNVPNQAQEPPLHVAARCPQVGEITIPMLVRAGARLEDCNGVSGNTVWHEWATHYPGPLGHTEDSQTRLFARYLPVNHQNAAGWTPLHFAVLHSHVMVHRLIHTYGANIHASNDGGQTPLHLACRGGSVLSVRDLLSAGAYMYVADRAGGRTPWHEAAVGGLLKLTEVCQSAARPHQHSLLNWSVTCLAGTTVLHNGVSHPSVVQFLLRQGAPVGAKDHAGWTALHYACWIGNLASIRLLLGQVDTDKRIHLLHERDGQGRTPMHLACGMLPQPTVWLDDGHNLANLRDEWWRVSDERAGTRWAEVVARISPSLARRGLWDANYHGRQRDLLDFLLQQGAAVLRTDAAGNFPWAYCDEWNCLYRLVHHAAVHEGLF
jgi:ankyrin repeat protein